MTDTTTDDLGSPPPPAQWAVDADRETRRALGKPKQERAMSQTVRIDIPQDEAVRAMRQDLHKMREGLAAMGLHAHILDQVSEKLKEQAMLIERYRSDRPYVIGHNDGWDAAMATGLAGDMAE